MRHLGLDFGERRIGLAISDPLGMMASPLGTLDATRPKRVVRRLRQIMAENDIDTLVVGLPLRTDNQPGEQAQRVREWATAVGQELNLPVVLVDERFSTREATARLRAAGESAASMRDRLDAAAATIILQGYLDRNRVQGPESEVQATDERPEEDE